MTRTWDYLIVTASNDAQAGAYETALEARRDMGLLSRAREVLVVADPDGRRVGSGGSTIHCLVQVLNREVGHHGGTLEEALRRLRVLIVHAGGDSRRLPAYSSCGKIFVPLPLESDSALCSTLFDRLASAFLALPAADDGEGQFVVTSGDALIRFDPSAIRFERPGVTALGCYSTPEEAARHGVFCLQADGSVRLYLQKPKLEEQARSGALNRYGQAVLDIGVMNFDGGAIAALFTAFGVSPGASGTVAWTGAMKTAVMERGLDLYREICCALGSEATAEHHRRGARSSGSTWDDAMLEEIYRALRGVPFQAQVLPQFSFLHFGATRQLIASGAELVRHDRGFAPAATLSINNELKAAGGIAGADSWVEGCRLGAALELAGQNVVVGADIEETLRLPRGACLDMIYGRTRVGTGIPARPDGQERPSLSATSEGEEVWFVRCYGVSDGFKDAAGASALFCGQPLMKWLAAVGAKPQDVWGSSEAPEKLTLWDARVFPAEKEQAGYRRWLWMYNPEAATAEQKQAFLSAPRYSAAEIALLADQEAFHLRRARIRAEEIRRSLRRVFSRESAFSAEDLAYSLAHSRDPAAAVAELLSEARWHLCGHGDGMEAFIFCRIVHSLASAICQLARGGTGLQPVPHSLKGCATRLADLLPGLDEHLPAETAAWLESLGLTVNAAAAAEEWAQRLRASAFTRLHEAILQSSLSAGERPRNALRSDETIWGRAPARLELGGGWTDTPPYTLEYGGDVANAAVNLNGQPPIHCYARVVEEPVIRLSSIDVGLHLQITELDELLDYRRPGDSFALAKAALAIAGFSPELWPGGTSLPRMLEEFGGGIELTTLVGIPKGSGLGTSSILGAVLVAVIRRMMGRSLNQREIFHEVLRLEQALTTGGGWQDQIGGGVGGSKITSTRPGLFPDPRIHYVPNDVLDPRMNGGSTLLYYTGLTRLAKNILEQVVGGFLNRNRSIMDALAREHEVARSVADAMARKDAALFGHYVNVAWELQKRLCGDVTNETIECLLSRVRPHIHGARILGAGNGGFLMMICKSARDAAKIREMLEAEPLNERARFFDFEINHAGLEITTC